MSAWIALGLLVVAGIVLVVRHDTGTIAGFDNADFAGIVAALALVIFLGGALLRNYRGGFTGAARDAVFWCLIALGLIAVYSYRDEVLPVAQRIASELVPGTPIQMETGDAGPVSVRIRAVADGQFVAQTHINGSKVEMVVDTGASQVVLTPSDAEKAGITLDDLAYSAPVQTANGLTYGAPVRLRSVSVGPVNLEGVDALVAKPGALHVSLLGMSFLSRLRSYEFSGDFLTLRS